MEDQSLLNSLMIKVRIYSEHKYDIIPSKGKKPLKNAYELASLPYLGMVIVSEGFSHSKEDRDPAGASRRISPADGKASCPGELYWVACHLCAS